MDIFMYVLYFIFGKLKLWIPIVLAILCFLVFGVINSDKNKDVPKEEVTQAIQVL